VGGAGKRFPTLLLGAPTPLVCTSTPVDEQQGIMGSDFFKGIQEQAPRGDLPVIVGGICSMQLPIGTWTITAVHDLAGDASFY
jgi:hypothetical protein